MGHYVDMGSCGAGWGEPLISGAHLNLLESQCPGGSQQASRRIKGALPALPRLTLCNEGGLPAEGCESLFINGINCLGINSAFLHTW